MAIDSAASECSPSISLPLLNHEFHPASLPKHTIFAPQEAPAGLKLPVLIWGNGGCSGNGTLFRRSLWEVASYGFFAIAQGSVAGGGMTSNLNKPEALLQKQALDWVEKNAGTGKWANVDKTRIAAAGQSCGGLETLAVWNDPRVKFVGIFNSGELNQATIAPKITKPIFYFLGGSSDIAYANGERDYKALPKTTPRWKGNLPVGHMATWSQTNSGKFGKAERLWLDWVLRGNATSSDFFLKGGAKADGWEVESAALDLLPPITPIQ
ncbi:hypothetical protein EJ06DRAFT_540685 [Trichodelitschia bisporula]|uniref:Alpha/beta-hydrolase n=1 Tax=Trichodelitschia bisporula TaxID=703511 RepID=A0A6G1IAU6_9PEZI|nr:hypothetical protein EJ06DRAFT_540685 [Trichodelitschia bisporula]